MVEVKYVDWDGLVYYDGKIKDYIDDKSVLGLKFGGVVSFDELPPPSSQTVNLMYKVLDSFVTTDWFDIPGEELSPGSAVCVIDLENIYKYTIMYSSQPDVEIDLSGYVTDDELKSTLSEAVSGLASVSDVEDAIKNKADVDYVESELDKKATQQDIEDAIENKVNRDELTNLATKDEVSTKADITYVNSAVDGLATTDFVEEITSDLATETFVKAKIAEAQLSGGEVDMSVFATKSDVTTALAESDSILYGEF